MKPSETKDEVMQRAETQSPLRCSSPASSEAQPDHHKEPFLRDKRGKTTMTWMQQRKTKDNAQPPDLEGSNPLIPLVGSSSNPLPLLLVGHSYEVCYQPKWRRAGARACQKCRIRVYLATNILQNRDFTRNTQLKAKPFCTTC